MKQNQRGSLLFFVRDASVHARKVIELLKRSLYSWPRAQSGGRIRLLRRSLWLTVLAIGLAVAWQTPSQADFMWMGDWNFVIVGIAVGPGSIAQPNFGSVTADLANASGTATTISDPTMNSTATVTVTFMRQFSLFNDPDDSLVTVFGTLSGALNASSAGGIFSSATALANAEIVGGPLILITAGGTAVALNDTDTDALMTSKDDSGFLVDGIYTVTGELQLELEAKQGPVGIADANADVNWIVGVSAISLPEPAPLLQLIAGICVLVACLGRQLTPRPTRQTPERFSLVHR